MGRKPKNQFIEVSLAFKENSKILVYDIKMPFLYALTVETNDPNIAKMQTTWKYFVKDDSNLDTLVKKVESQPFKVKVIKIEPVTMQITDICTRCHNRGVPKIEKKNICDNRERTWRNKENTSTKKERTAEYWLVYTHSKHKKCRICQYENIPNPKRKKNAIEIEKYFFPFVMEHMKNGSLWYADQSQ
ncbi:MAG: hypothetical protein KGL95_07875 [Patescibacteria group bacterium]|nr:hypothetical protein [Patescibacteria group bacterium]